MFTFLSEKRDKTLAQRWGVWLLKHDQDRAMRVRLFSCVSFVAKLLT